jgi:hypothetical protein
MALSDTTTALKNIRKLVAISEELVEELVVSINAAQLHVSALEYDMQEEMRNDELNKLIDHRDIDERRRDSEKYDGSSDGGGS